MSKKAPRSNQQILEEASTWFVAFRSQDLRANAQQDFHDWLKRSPEHIRAYLEIASVYAQIPAPEQGRTPPELIEKARASADVNVVALTGRTRGEVASGLLQISHEGDEELRRVDGPDTALIVQRPWFLASRVALATSILIFAVLGSWLYADRNTYRTDIGEQRSITLSDGSIVVLNARSKVRIDFRDEQRDVELLEGQALFRVAKDHTRSFVVHAGAASVRAVGTQFDVYRKSTGTIVSVVEGRVAVLSRTSVAAQEPGSATDPAAVATPEPPSSVLIAATRAPAHPPTPGPSSLQERAGEILLLAGEQMTVTPTHAEKAARPNIAAASAWTQHQLVFDGTPLSEVLEEFSRYTTRRLIVDTPELATLRISGQYTSTGPDSLLRFLSLQKGVVVTESNGEIHIRQE